MATALQGFRLTARSCACLASKPQLQPTNGVLTIRTFTSTPTPWLRKNDRAERMRQRRQEIAEQKIKDSKSRPARRIVEAERRAELAEEEEGSRGTGVEEWQDEAFEKLNNESIGPYYPPFKLPPDTRKKKKDTFLNMGEEEPWESEEMMLDDEDDITSLGHGELERHREMRHYARLIAWEMPMLTKLAKPFVPPTADMPLRFRYTSYMGENHPAEKKVVVEFTTADMPSLTPVQRMKLAKLLGVRYNPTTDIAKMSCEMYETQAQNKRYLGNTIDKLLIEARDPTDTFEDVPLDTRHHYFKPRPRFPEEWVMTKSRQKELKQHRQDLELVDATLAMKGQLIDGMHMITEGLKRSNRVVPEPEMIMAGKGGQKKLGIRRN